MLTLRSADELVAAVPYLLGYHPDNDLVVVALRDRQVELTLCAEQPADPSVAADLCRRHGVTSALILGYGGGERGTGRLADELRRAGVPVLEELRVHDGHYWSPADPHRRRPIPTSSVAAASATYHGLRALPSRAALAAEQAPVSGAEREAMTAATRRAEARMAAMERKAPTEEKLKRAVRRAGVISVRAAERRHRAGGRLKDLPAAWLTVLLARSFVFGSVWNAPRDDLQGLWTDLVRRADERYVAGPACLLAYVAWRSGQGSVARIAVDRALAADPDHKMAGALDAMLYAVRPR
ncbi:DUF4192 domain-containing protein [Actinoplanes sp. NPDC049265]|uniref:DUF4192 domain-containing protein n=1 Tax=Actinoplanes sp. NPDC049265 TaxID=3363902 RepID=UPI00371F96A7